MCSEIGEVGSLMTQDQCLLVQAGVFNVVLNLPLLQLPSKLCYLFQKYPQKKPRDQL